MNKFFIQGKLLKKELKPKGSILLLVETGMDLKETKNLITPVNKLLIRVPARLTRILNNIEEESLIEVEGTFIGRVYYSMSNEEPIGTVQLLATRVDACVADRRIKPKDLPKYYQSRFVISSIVKAIKLNPDETKKDLSTLFVQLERPISRNQGELEQPTSIIPMRVSKKLNKYLHELAPQQFIVADGKVFGVTTKIPMVDRPGEFEERIEVSLLVNNINKTSLLPAKLFESKRQNFEKYLAEKELNASEENKAELDKTDPEVNHD